MSNKGVRPVTKAAAYGGIGTALIVLLLLGTSLFPFMEYTVPAACAVVIFFIGMECSDKTALICYAASSLLGLILLPNKEAVMLFALFFGYYPLLKQYLARKLQGRFRSLQTVIKYAVFNTAMVSAYLVLIYLFGLHQLAQDIGLGMKYGMVLMLAAGNFAFYLFDLLMLRFEQIYLARKMGMKIRFDGYLVRMMRRLKK